MDDQGKVAIDLNHYGHPKFYKFCNDMQHLHSKKNHDYAKGGAPLGNFERVSAIKRLYPGVDWTSPEMVAFSFMMKQFDAYLHLTAQGHKTMTGEGKKARLFDIAVYIGIIYCIESDKENIHAGHAVEASPTERNTLRDREPRIAGDDATYRERENERHSAAAGCEERRDYIERPPTAPGGSPSKDRRRPR